MGKDSNYLIDAARYAHMVPKQEMKKPNKLLNFFWIVLLYIIGVINRAFLVPFPIIDSLSIQNITELSATDRERYHREVKNVIYRMVFIALIAGIWFIFKIIRFFFA